MVEPHGGFHQYGEVSWESTGNLLDIMEDINVPQTYVLISSYIYEICEFGGSLRMGSAGQMDHNGIYQADGYFDENMMINHQRFGGRLFSDQLR